MVSGARPVHRGPWSTCTIYPSSKEALGAASLLFFSEISQVKFSEMCSSPGPEQGSKFDKAENSVWRLSTKRGFGRCFNRGERFNVVRTTRSNSENLNSAGLPTRKRLGMRQRTIKIALLLVTLPARLLTVTAKSAPLSPAVVGGVVYDALVASGMFTPFFVH